MAKSIDEFNNLEWMGDSKKALGITGAALLPYLVAAYRQGDAISNALGPNSDVKGGVCVALSMHWIRQHQSNRNTPRLGENGLFNSQQVINEARAVQLAYTQAKKAAGENEAVAQTAGFIEAAKRYRMALIGDVAKHTFSEATLLTQIKRVHSYHVVALAGLGVGHATATYMSSGKILGFGRHLYLFDPNIGELKIPESEVAYAIAALTTRYQLLDKKYKFLFRGEIKP
ncbi:MAG: hypothetical protein K5Q68_20875 [Roseococcus sp.]|nr:hypothetical protein [Roseococcus sp.]